AGRPRLRRAHHRAARPAPGRLTPGPPSAPPCPLRDAPPRSGHSCCHGCARHALAMPIVVGTSGWQYRDWRGLLYPPDLPQRDWLGDYAGQYATVENNSTFYRLPARDTFADCEERAPGGFG